MKHLDDQIDIEAIMAQIRGEAPPASDEAQHAAQPSTAAVQATPPAVGPVQADVPAPTLNESLRGQADFNKLLAESLRSVTLMLRKVQAEARSSAAELRLEIERSSEAQRESAAWIADLENETRRLATEIEALRSGIERENDRWSKDTTE
jgi:hypothetical protein